MLDIKERIIERNRDERLKNRVYEDAIHIALPHKRGRLTDKGNSSRVSNTLLIKMPSVHIAKMVFNCNPIFLVCSIHINAHIQNKEGFVARKLENFTSC